MSKRFPLLVMLGLFKLWAVANAQNTPSLGPPIPENTLRSLNQELFQALKDTKSSSVRRRRSFKNLVSDGEDTIKSHPHAPNRFRVLEIILQSQIKLLGLQKTQRNREAIFNTSAKLSEAPDEYAEIRFRAEILLSEKKLSEKESTYEDHAKALTDILSRYDGSSAEARILMKGVTIASSLNAYELKESLIDRLDDEFMHDQEVIEFRREIRSTNLRASFKNKFLRTDGTELCFPQDSGGKFCIFAFWSTANPSIDETLGYLKGLQEKYPEALQIFSLNLDNLPDAGKSKLDQLGLDWQTLVLPEGRDSKVYSTYARSDPTFVFVDAYGYTLLKPRTGSKNHGLKKKEDNGFSIPAHMKINESLLTLERFLNQLQSMNIGDFLVQSPSDSLNPSLPPELMMVSANPKATAIRDSISPIKTKITQTELKTLQDTFIPPPFRYRLPPSKAFENYQKAEALSRSAIQKYSDDPGVWILRNRRIIALLGMWQTAFQPKYLEQAIQEANASLATNLPRGADIVPYFCLAKEALRLEKKNPEEVLAEFVKNTGGNEAPESAIAAAATLALFNIRKYELQTSYREAALVSTEKDSPLLWPVHSFLRDKCNHYFFSGLSTGFWRNSRWHIINHTEEGLADPLPELTLKSLEGKPLVLPRDTSEAQTLLLFIEPPKGSEESFPIIKDEKGNVSRADYIRSAMSLAQKLHSQKEVKNVNIIAAFLSDNPEEVRRLMKVNNWTFKAAMLPRGLSNPMITRLNILSADRFPNLFLIRRDGTVSWSMSGLKYGESHVFPEELALRAHFERNEVEWGVKVLSEGDPKKAAKALTGPFPKDFANRYAWRGPRKHGLTLAHIALRDWNSALQSVNDAIFEHMARHSHGIPRPRRASLEKKSQFGEKVLKEKPHEIISELWRLKTLILEHLKRDDEASLYRALSEKPSAEDPQNAYNHIHYKLIELASKIEP